MNLDEGSLVRINQLKFIGKILSVYTHDLNNQLGTIKEAAGLMEDIIEHGNAKNTRVQEELAKPLHSIDRRVGAAAFLTNTLSVFGRGMAGETSSLNLKDSVGELLVLVKRMAAQRRVEFVTDFQHDIPAVTADPIMFQFLLFCLMEEHLMGLKAKGRLIFKITRAGKVLSVVILPEGEVDSVEEKRTFPEGMAQLIAKTHGFSIAVKSRESCIMFHV
ncbi:MAG: hypothetical protein PHI06_01090 [Desulfobulbaceae bacterium]|nr:hypothetical protein [Desulfobulbaceae bacterium]